MFNQKVLAEQGEVFKAPNGQIQKISNNAPSHDDGARMNRFGIQQVEEGEGGVEINADSVLSDSQRQVNNGKRENNIKEEIVKIKPIEGENIAGQLGLDIKLKKAISPSQLFLEIQKAKDKKTLAILGKSKNSTNSREGQNANNVNASQIAMLPSDEEIYDAVFEYTEGKKKESGVDFEEKAQYGVSIDEGLIYNMGHVLSKERKDLIKNNIENEYARSFGQRYFTNKSAKIKNEQLLYGLDVISGEPTIENKSQKEIEKQGGRRAFYSPIENKMILPNDSVYKNAYLPELAHSYQYNSPNPNIFGKWDIKKYNNNTQYDNHEYNRENSLENQAHSKIDDFFDDIVYNEKTGKEKYKKILNSDNNRNKLLRRLYHPNQNVTKEEHAKAMLDYENNYKEGQPYIHIDKNMRENFKKDINTKNKELYEDSQIFFKNKDYLENIKNQQFGGSSLLSQLNLL